MRLAFSKYEGLGNDFMMVEADDVPAGLEAGLVRALCDRHLGVGADGVITTGVREGRPFMRVQNADGSVPGMCGNGIRCVALHLVRTERAEAGAEIIIDTDSGPHACRVAASDGRDSIGSVEVRMRPPSLVPADVPVRADAPLIDASMSFGADELRITTVSMGNPHAVTFDDVGERRLSIGPRIGGDPRFPEGVNVGFARTSPGGDIVLHVLERGAGWTRACGTGACAAAVAAVETGRASRGQPIAVELPGGRLRITVAAPGEPVTMDGPARHVFDGQLDLGGFGA